MIATPHELGYFRHQLQQASRRFRFVAYALWTLDRLDNIGDDAIAPAAHFVAEEAEATRCAYADRTLGHDTSLAAHAPRWRLLNHVPPLGHGHLER